MKIKTTAVAQDGITDMRKQRIKIITVLAALMLSALSLPVAFGQTDGFYTEGGCFREGGDPVTVDGTWGSATPTDYESGNEMPVGKGLLILAVSAAIYLHVGKRKGRNMTAPVCAVVLALTMTQCRKTGDNIPAPVGETISISLNAGNGDRANINVENGLITWETGDKVYVVCNNLSGTASPKLLGGNLTASSNAVSSAISGSVTVPGGCTLPTNPVFVFYYVGKGVAFSNTSGATSLTFNIADQSSANVNDAGEFMIGRSEPITMAKVDGKYLPKEHPGMARTFLPLTAVLRLDVSELGTTDQEISLHGDRVYNTMEINLASPTPTCSKGGGATDIRFKVGGDARISVMPAACASPYDTVNLNFSRGTGADLKWGMVGIKYGIEAGRIYVRLVSNVSNPIPVSLYSVAFGTASPFSDGNWNDSDGNSTASAFGEDTWVIPGTLSGVFTVGPKETNKVRFSQGNLYYDNDATTGKEWNFEANQYDYRTYSNGTNVGTAVINGTSTTTETGDWGLFGWSTNTYYGKNTSTSSSSYSGDFVDWGNIPTLPGNSATVKVWRTLRRTEWDTLLFYRTTESSVGTVTSNARYSKVKVNGVKGLLIYPDSGFEWTSAMGTAPASTNVNATGVDFPNEYTAAQFKEMQEAGAVFLPAAGRRNGTGLENVSNRGFYWSSTAGSNYRAGTLWFDYGDVWTLAGSRECGYAVRLVRSGS